MNKEEIDATDWLNRKDLSNYLRMGRSTLYRVQAASPDFPKPHAMPKLNYLKLWSRDEVKAWVEKQPLIEDKGEAA